MTVIGVLHPGEMGAAVAGALVGAGHEVRWASRGRSPATRARAEVERLVEVADLAALVDGADVVMSVCPPGAATEVCDAVLATGFRGLFVDANAIAPTTARDLAHVTTGSGARFVDGGIVGPPPRSAGTTWLHLSGDRADEVAGLFAGTPLATVVHDGGPGAASAVKACFAAWTKGSAALLVAVRATAVAHGVDDALVAQWAAVDPGLAPRSEAAAASLSAKGWRWEAEMQEIADTFAAGGLPPGFHEAAAEVCARLAGFRDERAPLDDVVAVLLGHP